VAYRRRLPVLVLAGLVVALLAVAVLINLAMAPLVDYLDGHVFSRLSQLLGGTDPAGFHRYSQAAVLAYFVSNLLLNGLFDPFVEELYYRGHLLPRMPLTGLAAIAVNALLFAVQHLWQLSLAPLLFVLQLVLMSVMVALRDLRISIAAHAAANVIGTTLSLLAYLSAG
jgi:hypothetical protein